MTRVIEFSVSGLVGNEGTYSHKLNRDINIFFGLNGSGKTSLLKILHSALSNNAEILKDVPFEAAKVKIFSENYGKEFVYSIKQRGVIQDSNTASELDQSNTADLTIDYIETRNEPSSSSNITWDIKPKLPSSSTGKWAHRYLPTSRLYSGFSSNSYELSLARITLGNQKEQEEPLDILFSSYLQALWSQYSARILRIVREAQEEGLTNVFKSLLSKEERIRETEPQVDPEIAYNRVAAFLKRRGSLNSLGSFTYFKERYENDPSFKNIVSDINDVENRIAQATDRRDKLQDALQKMFSGNKKISFQDNSVIIENRQSSKIDLNLLSSGEKHLLMILINVVMAERNSILIDEPELSIHIDWQRQLINVIHELNPSAQLILATHSPEVMADISDDRIFSL